MKSNQPEIKHISLFAGMGGFIIGLNDSGVKTIMANDNEPACSKTLSSLFPDTIHLEDSIASPQVLNFARQCEDIDILSAGFPCQTFSIAGNQAGFNDLEKGSRFFDIIKFIECMARPPKIIFLENVPNLKTFNKGQWLSQIISELRFQNYWINGANCFCLNSSQVTKTPQNRERLFMVAYHSSFFLKNYFSSDFSNHVSTSTNLWDIIDRTQEEKASLYLDSKNKYFLRISAEAERKGADRLFQIRRNSVRANPRGVCPTLTANMGGGGHNVPFVIDDFGIRRLSVSECLILQGFNVDNFSFPDLLSDTTKLKMIGNAVNPEVVSLIGARLVEDLKRYGEGMAISA